LLLGLTGGIATGKSTVSAMFRQRGAKIVDADQIAHEVVEPDTKGSLLIRQQFGSDMFTADGRLDRKKLGRHVFQHPSERKKLEQILHPLIRQEMKEQTCLFLEIDPKAIVILDVPLLFESHLTTWVEKVIVVYVPEHVQLTRLINRDHFAEAEAKQRIQAQMSIEEKKRRADFVIDNQGSYQNTERQVNQLWNFLISKNG
jgi:dephospho-CoA kinase